ncbi:MAG: SPOR domain-containing protein, partial [Pseudomonadota bacterium]
IDKIIKTAHLDKEALNICATPASGMLLQHSDLPSVPPEEAPFNYRSLIGRLNYLAEARVELPLPVPQNNEVTPPETNTQTTPAPLPRVRVVEQEDKPKVEEKPPQRVVSVKPAPASDPGSGWVAQVGSFGSEENANRLTARLKKAGYPAFVMRHRSSGRAMFRVRVGPEKERRLAQELAERLKRDGHESKVVAHP